MRTKSNTHSQRKTQNERNHVCNIIRFVAAPVAAAGIIGGAALGFSALANASTVAAAPTASTTDTGNATLYQTPGDVQINTQPGIAAQDAAQQQYPSSGMAMAVCCFITAAATADASTGSMRSGPERSFDPALV